MQQKLSGRDYRVVVLDGAIISAYERIPLSVVGDGKHAVRELLTRVQKRFVSSGRGTHIDLDDPRFVEKLQRQHMTMESVLDEGERIFLLDNANLSSGGESVDVTNLVHAKFREICIRLAHDMGLRLCGVDLLIEGSIEESPKKWWILEVNHAPGPDHYATTGMKQRKIVESLYTRILLSMEKEHAIKDKK